MKPIVVEMSARHIHLSQEDLEALFGKGYELTVKKELSQPGQYACEERVTVKGPRGAIERVSILGPVRKATQLEVSLTDARVLGVEGVVRESGQVEGTPGIEIINGDTSITVDQGVIVAKRHIHMHSDDAKAYNVEDKEVVMTRLESENRSLIFDDVVIRVSDSFNLAMHIDVDEANAVGAPRVLEVKELIKK
jgi:putative phosphotransacetylase